MYPLISIVFTSYNHIRFLRKALESLLAQTYPNFEIIVVDDASNDGSQEILKGYSYDKRIKLFLMNSNSGSYVYSTNFGADKAEGEFLLFAQCDDFAEPMQLEKLYNAISNNIQTNVAFCRSNMIDKEGFSLGTDYEIRESKFRKQCFSDVIINRKQMTKYLCKSCVIPNLSAALVRKELFEQVGGFLINYLVVADWAFWLEISQLSDFYYVSTPLNNFRQHETTIRSTIKVQKQVAEIYEMFYGFISRHYMNSKDRFKLKINIAAIWIYYFPLSPKKWILNFLPILRVTRKFDKFSLFYFALAAISTFFLFVTKKITQLLRKISYSW